jgi:hypothetical protein
MACRQIRQGIQKVSLGLNWISFDKYNRKPYYIMIPWKKKRE